MNKEELQKILKDHEEWLEDSTKGKKADLRGADLSYADLRLADLEGADLCNANLYNADLSYADLRGADLEGADLRGAVLRSANLRNADLCNANLRNADLFGADLRNADLGYANLRNADLRSANLRYAVLEGADLPHFQIVPQTGAFQAFKKTSKGVIKILIPDKAKRTSSLVGRKCRAEYIKVLSGDGLGGISPTRTKKALTYNKGDIIHADSFNDDIRLECTNGIHFFMTYEEAKEW